LGVLGWLGLGTGTALAGSPEPSGAAPTGDASPVAPGTEGSAGSALEVSVQGERAPLVRSASQTTRERDVLAACPHRTGGDLLQEVPGVFITQHSGQGKAYQIFYRGFDAVHGQDLELQVAGAPVNEVSNIHGQGYADLHFVPPEVVSRITILPGNYSPEQGDFAVAGTIRYELGYEEPGVTAKATSGSFGERRVFLAYHPSQAPAATFAAFENQRTDGFGPDRAASRTSAIAQGAWEVSGGRLRLMSSGYAGRFDSPGVVALADLDAGRLGRFDTYGVAQGGFSSRYQLVGQYDAEQGDGARLELTPYAIRRVLELKQNYTGYLLDETHGDSTQLLNESTTLGFTGQYQHPLRWLSEGDGLTVGVSVRTDFIEQQQLDVSSAGSTVLRAVVDARIRATDAAGWLELALAPTRWLHLRGAWRLDGLAYAVIDETPASEARAGADPDAFARKLRPVSPGGQARSSMGTHSGPRATLDATLSPELHAVVSWAEGFRSPQARSLGDGERAPFTTVQSSEAGLRYATDGFLGTWSVFRTTLDGDLVFDAATTRNEAVPGSERLGSAAEFTARPNAWFVSSGSVTYTRATFRQSDATYAAGDELPYVPQLVLREQLAFTPRLGRLGQRELQGRLGTALTGMLRRPQPYGQFGHEVFLVDATGEVRLREVALGLDVFNVLDARWYDSEFTYSARWDRSGPARLVPERYVTVGAPRTILLTLSLFAS